MEFEFQPMNDVCARVIAGWNYEGAYGFYDMEQDSQDLEELLNPCSRHDRYYSVTDNEEDLVGFFCFDQEKDVVIIGLGLRPDLTGKGLGHAFFEAGLDFARKKYNAKTFVLDVATFNRRAINVYRKSGFEVDEVLTKDTNSGQHEFLRMTREA